MNQNSIPIFNAFIFAKFKLKEKKNMHWQPRAIPSLRLSLSLFAIRKPVLFWVVRLQGRREGFFWFMQVSILIIILL